LVATKILNRQLFLYGNVTLRCALSIHLTDEPYLAPTGLRAATPLSDASTNHHSIFMMNQFFRKPWRKKEADVNYFARNIYLCHIEPLKII
jgi:hypothetical protein